MADGFRRSYNAFGTNPGYSPSTAVVQADVGSLNQQVADYYKQDHTQELTTPKTIQELKDCLKKTPSHFDSPLAKEHVLTVNRDEHCLLSFGTKHKVLVTGDFLEQEALRVRLPGHHSTSTVLGKFLHPKRSMDLTDSVSGPLRIHMIHRPELDAAKLEVCVRYIQNIWTGDGIAKFVSKISEQIGTKHLRAHLGTDECNRCTPAYIVHRALGYEEMPSGLGYGDKMEVGEAKCLEIKKYLEAAYERLTGDVHCKLVVRSLNDELFSLSVVDRAVVEYREHMLTQLRTHLQTTMQAALVEAELQDKPTK